MTLVTVDLRRPDADGEYVAVRGAVEWAPTRRRATDGHVVLPQPFRHEASAPVTVDVAPTGPDWCWQVKELTSTGITRHVAVPDVPGPVAYAALTDVDPATLDPVAEPEAAWWAALTDYREETGTARDEAVAAAAGAAGSAAAAGLSASAAAASEDLAEGHASDASGSAGAAASSASAASGSAVAAAGSESAAAGHATDAQSALDLTVTARDLTLDYRDTAAGHATTATTQAGLATTARTGAEAARDTATAAAAAAQAAGGGVTTALYLPGVDGNNVTCPDSPATSVTGDLDLRMRFSPAALGVAYALAAKSAGNNTNKSFQFSLRDTGMLTLSYSADGGFGASQHTTTPVPGLAAGSWVWVRFTVDIDNGAGGTSIAFYHSDDGSTWNQLSANVVSAIPGLYASTSPLEIGSMWGGSGTNALSGLVQRFELRNGIDGPVVASWDGRVPATRYRDPQGNIWTVNGTANAWEITA